MNITLDPQSPVPLFHQIAEAIRYQLSTGKLEPGQALPTLRDAAERWQVNLHTVRRAYAELVQQGLVESLGSRGTRIVDNASGGPDNRSAPELQRYLRRVVRDARERFGLSPTELTRALQNLAEPSPRRPLVHVVECSESQCRDHARELESRWSVEARPWSLARDREPPKGPVVATYFHYNEIRRRWPERLHEIRFAAIAPDPALARRFSHSGTRRLTLQLCEYEEAMAWNIIADLSLLFPEDRFLLKPRVTRTPRRLIGSASKRTPLLFSPRLWDTLTEEERAQPHVHGVGYRFLPEELERIGHDFDWRSTKTRVPALTSV